MSARNFIKAWMLWPHLSSERADRGPVRVTQTPSVTPELDGGLLQAGWLERRKFPDGGKLWEGPMHPDTFTAWQPYMAVCQREKERRN